METILTKPRSTKKSLHNKGFSHFGALMLPSLKDSDCEKFRFLCLCFYVARMRCGLCWCGLCRCGLCRCGLCRCGLCRCGLCRCGLCRCGIWTLQILAANPSRPQTSSPQPLTS